MADSEEGREGLGGDFVVGGGVPLAPADASVPADTVDGNPAGVAGEVADVPAFVGHGGRDGVGESAPVVAAEGTVVEAAAVDNVDGTPSGVAPAEVPAPAPAPEPEVEVVLDVEADGDVEVTVSE